MIELLFWSSLRFVCVAIPLAIALIAARRALRSQGYNALIYMIFSGLCRRSRADDFAMAFRFDDLSPPALLLAISAVIFWGALNRLIRRPMRAFERDRIARDTLRLPTIRDLSEERLRDHA